MQNVGDKEKVSCCGCGLCVKVCPRKAIELICTPEGFFYPSVNHNICNNCGLCVKKCAFKNNLSQDYTPQYKLAISKYLDILKKSASGGVFTHISDVVLQSDGVVYGASYDKNFSVVHSRGIDELERNKFRDSKYVQSTIINCYEQVAEDLKSNLYVLFSGTPCQCKAIRDYLHFKRIDIKRLIIVDLVCHGVASPMIWEKYIEFVKKKLNVTLFDKIITRNKDIGRGYNLTFCAGQSQYCLPGTQDPFINMFCKNLIIRDSCFSCPLKSKARVGDITIGDFHKYRMFIGKDKAALGVSLIIISTPKGQELFNKVENCFDIIETGWDDAKQINLTRPILPINKQEEFFSLFKKKGFEFVLLKYTEVGFFNHIKGCIKRIIKMLIKKFVFV